ncbi:hypothetical protein Sjap_016662 [Stephania japonica]|uniref:Uncharacterized protein n=1 Tax=Stephania japonica TaxID=461633 RepID=A0AAP0NU19_9MAGN
MAPENGSKRAISIARRAIENLQRISILNFTGLYIWGDNLDYRVIIGARRGLIFGTWSAD